jgi:hypothetical protein
MLVNIISAQRVAEAFLGDNAPKGNPQDRAEYIRENIANISGNRASSRSQRRNPSCLSIVAMAKTKLSSEKHLAQLIGDRLRGIEGIARDSTVGCKKSHCGKDTLIP